MINSIDGDGAGSFVRPLGFLPFITTSPIFDVAGVLLLFPFWWVIGVEQFIWSLAFAFIFFKSLVAQNYVIKVTKTIQWLFLFLLIHLISGFFISETFRLVTFLRNFGTYIALFCLIVVLINHIKSWHEIERLLQIYVMLMILTAVIGLLAIFEIWQPNFTSVIGNFMPEWIKSTSYGQRIASRSVGNWSWFVILGRYFRVSSLFLYATLYASALGIAIPVTLFLLRISLKTYMKLFYVFGLVAMLINIVYTTGRIAVVGCLVGGLYYLIFLSRWRTITKVFVSLGLLLLVLAILYSNSLSVISDLYEAFVFARGGGSFFSRSEVYRVTLQQFTERPFFGWGTERDIADFPYPAGSHSYYLGILYKQGLFGLLTFLGFLYFLWRDSVPVKILTVSREALCAKYFLLYGRWVIIAFAVNSFTDVLELDATTLIFFGLVAGLLIKAHELLIKDQMV